MKKGINGKLYTQAANSPDINLLDLEFFRVIQSFNDAVLKNKEELIQVVSMAYESYLQNKINHTWLTLQCCFNQTIVNNGDNNYNIDHILKEKSECIGQLLDVMDVVEDVAQLLHNYLTLMEAQLMKLMQAQMTKLMMNKHKHKHKPKRIPILPTKSGRMGAMTNDCPIGVGVFVVVCVCFLCRCVFSCARCGLFLST